MAYVVVFAAGAPPQRFQLSGPAIIGRALGCDIWIDDGQLSRRHCTIEPSDDGTWFLKDLESMNGTFLERDQVRSHVLKDGDALYIGQTRIHFHADTRASSHRPADPNDAFGAGTADSPADGVDPISPRKLPTPVPMPSAASTSDSAGKKRRRGAPMSLPFSRPPARPIVTSTGRSEDPGLSSSWFSAVVARLRRGGSNFK